MFWSLEEVSTRTIRLLPMLLVLTGCGSPVSNDNNAAREALSSRITTYQTTSPESPQYREDLMNSARLKLLMGAAYANSRLEQRRLYRESAEAAESLLRSNSAVSVSQSMPEIAIAAEKREFEALFLWSTSVFYHFRDVASFPEKVLSQKKLRQARDVLLAIQSKDPDWGDGIVPFSLGIYYLSVPETFGGDRQRASRLMEKAVTMGETRLIPRWGRAKYLAVALGDSQLFVEDLEWVLQQDVKKMDGPVEWNRYFQEDARALLEAREKLF